MRNYIVEITGHQILLYHSKIIFNGTYFFPYPLDQSKFWICLSKTYQNYILTGDDWIWRLRKENDHNIDIDLVYFLSLAD